MRFCLFIMSTFLVGCSFAKDNSALHRTIEVQGVGHVVSVPDRFSFNLSVKERGTEASKLNEVIVEKTGAVVKALFDIGIEEKAVQSLQVQFNPWIEYKGNTQKQKGFVLTRQIKVTLKSLSQYERAIDVVLKLGVSNINQFNFTHSQADQNYQNALQQALLNARQRATDMAQVLDLKLGAVISISELSTGQATPVAFSSRQSQVSESYQAGETSTQASVKVLFALQDG